MTCFAAAYTVLRECTVDVHIPRQDPFSCVWTAVSKSWETAVNTIIVVQQLG